MDDLVRQAMVKWPNVPACYGWLGLDARGNWRMRDARVQAQGAFPAALGSRIEHDALKAFIERNYAGDAQGRWFFQNGPQQVFVELAAAPWVWRVGAQGALTSHTGLAAQVLSTWLDEDGRLFALADLGFGLVHSQDMHAAAQALTDGAWPQPQPLRFSEMPGQFGYVLSPGLQAPDQAAP